MSQVASGSDAVRLGEALQRCVAHLRTCADLYGRGRKADALLHAARPITDVLPWLETELRSFPKAFAAFTNSISAVGAAARHNARPRKLRKTAREAEKIVDRLLATVVGSQSKEPAFRASVAAALLQSALTAYERAVEAEDLGEYQTARALSALAGETIETLAVGETTRAHLKSLDLLIPDLDPPAQLARPSTVREIVDALLETLVDETGARPPGETTLDGELAKIERLVDDIVSSYTGGVPALSARLAASLYIRSFEPVRNRIAARHPTIEGRLADLLGIELRRAINDGAPGPDIQNLGAEAKTLLASLRSASTAEV